jgi:CRISPR system Cascade subunit CasB
MTDVADVPRTNEERFVDYLHSLAAREDRGALAALRRGLGRPSPPAEVLRLVVPHLPADRPWEHKWYLLVASLFAMHPERGGRGNLGETFHRLGNHPSAQKRFVALLDADAEDVPHRLRQAVALARSKPVPVDWYRLLKDLTRWNDEDRKVQENWARAYWRPSSENQGQAEPADHEKGA